MIRQKHSSGNEHFAQDEQIRYQTVWNIGMETKGGMRFYDGPSEYVVDITLGDSPDELVMISYPHNHKSECMVIASANEGKIREMIAEAKGKNPNRFVFTFDFYKGEVKLIDFLDFSRYTPLSPPVNELFTFHTEDGYVNLPPLYLFTKAQAENPTYGGVFKVLAKVSRTSFPPIDRHTEDGARFTFMLFNSYDNLGFTSDVPNLVGVRWPTKASCEIPFNLKTKELEKFLKACGVDDVKFKDGKIVDESDEDDYDLADWNMHPAFMKETEAEVEAEEQYDNIITKEVAKSIKEKGTVSLNDAFTIGFEVVLNLIGKVNKIISVFNDTPGCIKKMCICNGLIYVIPLAGEDDQKSLANFLDIADEAVVICDETTFPHYQPPLLPAPDEF